MLAPVEDARAISRIAVGFMASKALFAALNLDLFSRLSGGVKSLETLARDTADSDGIPVVIQDLANAVLDRSRALLSRLGHLTAKYTDLRLCAPHLCKPTS